jgi:hypothetical protein
VAEGNDPANFLFCLNKADYLAEDEAAELRADFAARVTAAIGLRSPPSVFLISARQPEQFDLPRLRELLSREKSSDAVESSRGLAQRRQDRSLLGWMDRQRLAERAGQLGRLESDADELLTSRVALPILQRAVPHLLDDPAQRMVLTAPAVRLRMSRWPVVNALDALLAPLIALVQKNLGAASSGSVDPDAYLDGRGSVSSSVQAAFAQLHQLHPQQLSALYADRKLWESLQADLAAADLRRRFAEAIERQRELVLQRGQGRAWLAAILAPIRWLLTIGAILWFPIVQPILEVLLQRDTWAFSRQTLLVIVGVLSASHLLQSTTFLLLWLVLLWMLLRWSMQRRVLRQLARWQENEQDDHSLAAQTMRWTGELLEPIRMRRERIEKIIRRKDELTRSLID